MNDIDHVFEAAKKDPKDSVTISALADALEELGADGATVRALTIDGPTILIISFPASWDNEAKRTLAETSNKICQWLCSFSERPPIYVLSAPDDVSFRTIKIQAQAQKEKP